MGQHVIDSEGKPYHPDILERKEYVGASAYFDLDLRAGVILEVEHFPEMRKPSYKIQVDFGPVIGKTLPTGFVSQFLVLGALDPDGTVRLLELPEGVLPGSMVA